MTRSPGKDLRWAAAVFVVALVTPTVIDLLFAAVPRGWESRGMGPPRTVKKTREYQPAGSAEPQTLVYEYWLSHDSETGVATNTHVEAVSRVFPLGTAPGPVLSDPEVRAEMRGTFDALCAADGYPQIASAFDRLPTAGRITIEHDERRSLVRWRWFLVAIKQGCTLAAFVALVVFLALLPAWFAARRAKRVGCCTSCGYDLRGTTTGVCPECGRRG